MEDLKISMYQVCNGSWSWFVLRWNNSEATWYNVRSGNDYNFETACKQAHESFMQEVK